MENLPLTEAELDRLDELASNASPTPWISSIEGRDHTAGNDVIFIGERETDMYVFRDTTPAAAADLDFIAAARNLVPRLIAEVRQARSTRDE